MSINVNVLSRDMAVGSISFYGPLLSEAISRSDGRWTLEQAWQDIYSGVLAVFLVTDGDALIGVFTVRLAQSPERRWLVIEDLAGERIDEWIEGADDAVSRFARALDCTQVMAEGRKGWGRKLKSLGWRVDTVVTVKEIQP